MSIRHASPPRRPRVEQFVRLDFVLAVILTVIYPLYFFGRAVIVARHRHLLPGLLRYWRVSGLLMVAVYLLASMAPGRFVSGLWARLAIVRTLAQLPHDDAHWQRWRTVCMSYCLIGSGLQLWYVTHPQLLPVYSGAARDFVTTMHPHTTPESWQRWGERGLLAWIFVHILEQSR